MTLKATCENYSLEYNITQNSLCDLPQYGLEVICGKKSVQINNIFFTRGEAEARCGWLAQNKVFPENLEEVLCDIFCAGL